GLTDRGWDPEALPTAEFTVRAFNPRRPREILFQHLEKGLVGVAQPPKENGSSVTVRIEPGATVTGRLLDADGKPRAGVELAVPPGTMDAESPRSERCGHGHGTARHTPAAHPQTRRQLLRPARSLSEY